MNKGMTIQIIKKAYRLRIRLCEPIARLLWGTRVPGQLNEHPASEVDIWNAKLIKLCKSSIAIYLKIQLETSLSRIKFKHH